MHTWMQTDQISQEEIYAREAKRLPWLRDRMITLLEEGEKIFVLKGASPEDTRRIAELVRGYGPGSVLCVGDGGAIPSVARHHDNLLLGTIPKFAGPNAVTIETDGPSWVALCRMALHV